MTDYLDLHFSDEQLSGISMLGLAHIGDGAFELMVRSWLCSRGKVTSGGLHHETVRYVAAPAQARAATKILDMLSDEEANIYRRGRNARVNSVPQGANRGEYHAATALEALFGWLYLRGDKQRLAELFGKMMEEQ